MSDRNIPTEERVERLWVTSGNEVFREKPKTILAVEYARVRRHDGEHGRRVDAPPGGSPQGSRTGTALTVARARQIDVMAAIGALRAIVAFAYESGFHELGYDPVDELATALTGRYDRLTMIRDAAKDGASLTWIRAVADEGMRDEPMANLTALQESQK